ncbi:MAG: hypothetical protein JSU70_13010 [Phycisphaerales bacterium]|nr:MAG: hypothetical protein JSU70_13010 [Phycisphaerales bacterium]
MKSEHNNLEKNVSRLVKLTGDPQAPGRGFLDATMTAALEQLSGPAVAEKPENGRILAKVNFDRVMGWAAMVTVVWGAGLQLLLSNLVRINPFVAATALVAMVVNWLVYLGGFIL